MQQGAPSDPTLEHVAWIVLAAVSTLVARELWQAWSDRRERRKRDRLVLTELTREVFIIRGSARAIVSDINRERDFLAYGR